MFRRMAVLIAIVWLHCRLSKASEIPLDQLIMGISDHSSSIKNFSLTCDYKIIQRHLSSGKLDDPLIVHAVITVDINGRLKYESFDKKKGREKNDERHNIVAYNGSVMKTLVGNDQSFLWGSVKENSNNPPWFVDPRNYIYHYYTTPVEKILSDPTASIVVSTKTWEGDNVADVEVTHKQLKGDYKGMNRFLIDVEKGFAIVRRSLLIANPATHAKWFEYAFIEGKEYKEVAPGLWLPSKVISQFSPTPSPDNPSPEFANRTEIINTNWVINAKLSDDIFELTFPPGIMVKDEQTGKLYRTANINVSTLGQDARRGEALYQKQQRSTNRLWLTSIPLAILIVLLLYRYRFSKKRRQA